MFTKSVQISLIIIAALVIIGYFSFYIIDQKEQAIVLEFGEFVEERDNPGLYFKYPWHEVIRYDKRLLEVNLDPKTLPDVNQKQVNIDAFVKYKIIEPIEFYRSVNNYAGLFREVDSILMASLKNTVGKIPFQELLSVKRTEIINIIKTNVAEKAKDFGVEIVDLRIMRADLPKENADSIFKRMIAERQKEAKEFRSEGEEMARIIKSQAEKERTIILAKAKEKAEIIKGTGDAKATKIFAESFGKDLDFFGFYRAMQAYKGSVQEGNTSMVLSPESEFFKYFEQPEEQ